jgi:hypothetical protein
MGNAATSKVHTTNTEVSKRRSVIAAVLPKKKKHAFVWYYPNWESYLDENGNTYYYNDMLKETKWDPRDLEDIERNQTAMELEWERAAEEARLEKERLIEQRKELIQTDPLLGWKELGSAAQIDFDSMESHIFQAQEIIEKVSEGSFEPEIIYQLPWAYKINQLALATKDCYVNCYDFFDSSKYDNCNGVPRYDNGGLVAWWMDLEDDHIATQVKIESGVIGQESEMYTEEMKRLQAVASSGNEDDLLEGFLARKLEVEKELNNLRARYVCNNVIYHIVIMNI